MLRNWMEMRKLFLEYVYDSPSYRYIPIDPIFTRDDYKYDAGNLPHIYMVININVDEFNYEKKRKIGQRTQNISL